MKQFSKTLLLIAAITALSISFSSFKPGLEKSTVVGGTTND